MVWNCFLVQFEDTEDFEFEESDDDSESEDRVEEKSKFNKKGI